MENGKKSIIRKVCNKIKFEWDMRRIDRLWDTLKKKDISQYRLIKEYGIDYAQLHRLRHNQVVKTTILDRLCNILECQIEDIMEVVLDKDEEQE